MAGIDASLRRVAHYDLWLDSIRRSVLFDAKVDGIVYGTVELDTIKVVERLRD